MFNPELAIAEIYTMFPLLPISYFPNFNLIISIFLLVLWFFEIFSIVEKFSSKISRLPIFSFQIFISIP